MNGHNFCLQRWSFNLQNFSENKLGKFWNCYHSRQVAWKSFYFRISKKNSIFLLNSENDTLNWKIETSDSNMNQNSRFCLQMWCDSTYLLQRPGSFRDFALEFFDFALQVFHFVLFLTQSFFQGSFVSDQSMDLQLLLLDHSLTLLQRLQSSL